MYFVIVHVYSEKCTCTFNLVTVKRVHNKSIRMYFSNSLDFKKGIILSRQGEVGPEHSEDEVGGVLRDLQDDMEAEIERTHAHADRAIRDKQKVKGLDAKKLLYSSHDFST